MRGAFVGLTTLDLINYVQRFPEPDTKIQALDRWIGAGGPAANAAVTFASLGGDAQLITAIGASPAAEIARRDLEAAGVTVRDVADGGEIAISNIVVDSEGRRTVVSMNAAGFERLDGDVALGEVDVVLADGHHVDCAIPLLDRARSRGIATLLDAGSRKRGTDDLLARMDYVVASSAFSPTASAAEAARALLRPPVHLAAVSTGEGPIAAITDSGPVTVDVPAVDVVDTLGAGDVLHGALAYRLALGDDPIEALSTAARTASESCTVRGPRLPRPAR